ncbi:hypothetical protein IKD56_00795 [bacterium]|nr:hypothetical protein [bacterium]
MAENENKTINVTKSNKKQLNHLWQSVPSFVKFALAYGMIPTSFRLAMTYEEQVLWICNFLQETVIPSIQNDSEAITELQTAIDEIWDYLNDLDIPSVVEDKINEMIEDGTFDDLFRAYVDPLIESLQDQIDELSETIGNLNLPTVIDPETGEPVEVPMGPTLEENPQRLINPEYFYRFKNMVDNSSFEVFNGNTGIPIGWDNGIVTEDASMFNSHSLQINAGQIVKQTQAHYCDVEWLLGAYETNDVILTFYHKWDAVGVKIYDLVNEEYLTLTPVNSDLTYGTPDTEIVFPYDENWNQYRKMVKFTPSQTTRKIRIEFNCKTDGEEGRCFIDAPMMEPFTEGEYPSIYKDGKYSTSAYQLLNPPPFDVDRFTPLEHLNVTNSLADSDGQIYYQEMTRTDGTLAIKREASNPDTNGFYQTFVETFYKGDGLTVNYVDTYTYTYTDTGAILTKSKTTTEVIG